MEIRRFRNELLKEFEFKNKYGKTSTGFYHESTLMQSSTVINTHRAYYQNRAWELYDYQSSMMGTVRDLIEKKIASLRKDFKAKNNITRLTEKRKNELKIIIDSNEEIKLYRLMLDELDLYRF